MVLLLYACIHILLLLHIKEKQPDLYLFLPLSGRHVPVWSSSSSVHRLLSQLHPYKQIHFLLRCRPVYKPEALQDLPVPLLQRSHRSDYRITLFLSGCLHSLHPAYYRMPSWLLQPSHLFRLLYKQPSKYRLQQEHAASHIKPLPYRIPADHKHPSESQIIQARRLSFSAPVSGFPVAVRYLLQMTQVSEAHRYH